MTMTRRALAGLFLLSLALPLRADFAAVVRAVETSPGTQRVTIPFLGVARLAVWCVRPHGVHDFQLATFENRGSSSAAAMGEILARTAGKGFQPLVRVSSRKANEGTFIYGRPHDDQKIELMMVTQEGRDTVVIRALVDVDKMIRHLDQPKGLVRVASR